MTLAPAAPAFAPAVPSGTRYHFYRYLGEVGKASHPIISCDAFPVARMQNGRVYTMKMSAGRHAIVTSENPTGILVDIEADKEYFIRIDYSPNASFAIKATPVLVAQEIGREETKKLRPLDGWLVEDATCGK